MAGPYSYPPVEISTGAIRTPAMLAAAIFLGVLTCGEAVTDSGGEIGWETVPMVLPLLAIATPVGAALAAIPLLLGVHGLAKFGRYNVGTRHPAFWGMAGAGAAWTIAGCIAGAADPGPLGYTLIGTGALCAILARRYVRWSSEAE
jgi:hypothetical protein